LFSGAAVDCTVVSVVVILRSDGAGEENVLFRSPSVRGAVALVPPPEGAISDSAVVARVGGRDLGWMEGSFERETERLEREWDSELCRECEWVDDSG
jgi:hypothetical protein